MHNDVRFDDAADLFASKYGLLGRYNFFYSEPVPPEGKARARLELRGGAVKLLRMARVASGPLVGILIPAVVLAGHIETSGW